MRLSWIAFVTTVALTQGFAPSRPNSLHSAFDSLTLTKMTTLSAVTASGSTAVEDVASVEAEEVLEWKEISKLPFRSLKRHLQARGLETTGTTKELRERLHMACSGECIIVEGGDEQIGNCNEEEQLTPKGITWSNEADPDFDTNELVSEIKEKASRNHWKAATRKLAKLQKVMKAAASAASPTSSAVPSASLVPQDVYLVTLKACMADRLHGARASEPARRIMEDMVSSGYAIPPDIANYCILNSLGNGPDGTHDACGGLDVALAMIAAVEQSSSNSSNSGTTGDGPMVSIISEETYARVATVLAANGELEEALSILRGMIVDYSYTPTLGVFSDIAVCAVSTKKDDEKVMGILALAKAAGYELDTIASTVDGRELLAAGVVAASQMDNVALGLRLLTAASKAVGCEPDRGDALVATSSATAQRAAMMIHKKAVSKAIAEGDNWKLSVKLLELMLERSLMPSPAIWKNVVTCCAKNSKSRKATALLLDWMRLAEAGKTEKPPLRVFNTVVNACEVCDEQELTLKVLEAMKRTHETDGNIITFNIALKRLAKLGNTAACEGIIIGMLQQGVEPSVVSYTTAIAGCCAKDAKNPAMANEWLKRMRSRNVMPNVISYNTALAACLDGKLESSMLASKIATEMMQDVDSQLAQQNTITNAYTTVFPDAYTKSLARQLMKQLRDNWRAGDIDMRVAKATVRVPLLHLVDFEKSERAAAAALAKSTVASQATDEDGDVDEVEVNRDETELEYATAAIMHRTAEV